MKIKKRNIKLKYLKRLLHSLYIVFVILVVFLGIVTFLSVFDIAGLKILNVQSGSMEPSILAGSTIVIKGAQSYQANDIITFNQTSIKDDQYHQIVTTHRVVGKNGEEFITKGDANLVEDSYKVHGEDIIGKVIITIPFLGYLSSFSKTPLGFVVLIMLPGLLIIINEVFTLAKRTETKEFKIEKITN